MGPHPMADSSYKSIVLIQQDDNDEVILNMSRYKKALHGYVPLSSKRLVLFFIEDKLKCIEVLANQILIAKNHDDKAHKKALKSDELFLQKKDGLVFNAIKKKEYEFVLELFKAKKTPLSLDDVLKLQGEHPKEEKSIIKSVVSKLKKDSSKSSKKDKPSKDSEDKKDKEKSDKPSKKSEEGSDESGGSDTEKKGSSSESGSSSGSSEDDSESSSSDGSG